ncbi:MAG: hypothetical protein ACK40T_02685 [Akkermansiaceae bacterium]|jgi:hypothetical protein
MKSLKKADDEMSRQLAMAFMNMEYLQDAAGTLSGYHALLGNYTLSAEEVITMYMNLFLAVETYQAVVQKHINNETTVEVENGQKSIS